MNESNEHTCIFFMQNGTRSEESISIVSVTSFLMTVEITTVTVTVLTDDILIVNVYLDIHFLCCSKTLLPYQHK